MRVVIRVDASVQIGSGHVMRCLTLADALAAQGADCQFICQIHEGNLIEFIRCKGYIVHTLSNANSTSMSSFNFARLGDNLTHSQWLGVTQDEDAESCAAILALWHVDWLIVDHYALDARWEKALAPFCRKMMVIDDLADRPHVCDLLLDQTYGRNEEDYHSLVPADCQILCGSKYALLRPEFAALRPYSIQRRARPALHELLITMGGVDRDNMTGQVLKTLQDTPLPGDCRITVVMGATAPWLDEVTKQARGMPWPTRVLVGVSNMAQLMADSDVAIGAAGATTWERCCLGVPTIMLTLAENQIQSCNRLALAGAGIMIQKPEWIHSELPKVIERIVNKSIDLSQISSSSATITDGRGTERVIRYI